MKSIETRLNKKLGIDVDLFCMIYDDPSLADKMLEIEGVNFDMVKNTVLYYESDPESASLKYMLFRSLK